MNISFIEKMLSLDKSYFFNLKQFIIDLQKESRINNDYFFTDFKDAFQRELNKKRWLKSKYYYFIDKNKNILTELKNNDLLSEIYFYLSFNKEKKLFSIIDYLYENYDYKDLILDNLNKLKQLRITEFDFVSKLEENIRVYESKIGFYELNSIYADGKQKWYKTKNSYLVILENHSFIIKYNKNEKRGLTKIEMFLKSLTFDSKCLPRYDELYDLNVWQFIDKETIEKKTNLINNITNLEDDNYKLVNLYNKLLIDVEKLDVSDTSEFKNTLIKINESLEMADLIEQLKKIVFEENESIISIEEFNKVKKI